MNRATPQMRHFAKRLIVYERQGGKSSNLKAVEAFSVSEKLGPHLVNLMGNGGFRALLGRALTLAAAEIPWLRGVQVKADGTLSGLEEIPAQLDPAEFLEGRVVLLAQLLGLLVAFIGKNLLLRLIYEVWPKVSLNDLDLETRDKNEKAK
jgi:hypothetical protein